MNKTRQRYIEGGMNKPLAIKISLITLSLILYLIALLLPAFVTKTGKVVASGFACLVFGWYIILTDIKLFIIYLTNLLYFASIPMALFKITSYIAMPLMLVALLISIMIFFIDVTIQDFGGVYWYPENASAVYLWFLSYVILFAALFIPAHWMRKKTTS